MNFFLSEIVEVITHMSYKADISAAVVAMAITVIWYHPQVFGKAWSHLTGIKNNVKTRKALRKAMVWNFIMYVFLAANMAAFCKHFEWNTIDRGFLLGYDLGLMICVAMGIQALYERRPLKLYLITAGCILLVMSAMGMVIG
jgi:hypothetical protein